MPRKKTLARDKSRTAAMPLSKPPDWLPELEKWEHARYDGIKGFPPEWVPGSFRKKFYGARGLLFHFVERKDTTYAEIKSRFNDLVKKKYHAIGLALLKDTRPYDDSLRFLVELYQAVRMDEAKGLALLTDSSHAALVAKGKNYGQRQSSIARKPRGKIWAELQNNEQTINDVIASLLPRTDEWTEPNSRDLWSHFYRKLDNLGLGPEMVAHPSDPKKDRIEYDAKAKRKSIDVARQLPKGLKTFVRELRIGLRFVFIEQRVALLLMVLVALYNFGSTGFIFLLPVIAKEVLHVGVSQLGLYGPLSV